MKSSSPHIHFFFEVTHSSLSVVTQLLLKKQLIRDKEGLNQSKQDTLEGNEGGNEGNYEESLDSN